MSLLLSCLLLACAGVETSPAADDTGLDDVTTVSDAVADDADPDAADASEDTSDADDETERSDTPEPSDATDPSDAAEPDAGPADAGADISAPNACVDDVIPTVPRCDCPGRRFYVITEEGCENLCTCNSLGNWGCTDLSCGPEPDRDAFDAGRANTDAGEGA